MAGLKVALASRALVKPSVCRSIVSRPPTGIASRALMHRLSSAFSSCDGSTRVGQSPAAPMTSISTQGPTVRRISSSIPATSEFTSVGLGSSVRRRENASSRCVSAAAWVAAPRAAPMLVAGNGNNLVIDRLLSCRVEAQNMVADLEVMLHLSLRAEFNFDSPEGHTR
jgi:hypothetical protein